MVLLCSTNQTSHLSGLQISLPHQVQQPHGPLPDVLGLAGHREAAEDLPVRFYRGGLGPAEAPGSRVRRNGPFDGFEFHTLQAPPPIIEWDLFPSHVDSEMFEPFQIVKLDCTSSNYLVPLTSIVSSISADCFQPTSAIAGPKLITSALRVPKRCIATAHPRARTKRPRL